MIRFPFRFGPATVTAPAVAAPTPLWVRDTPGSVSYSLQAAVVMPRFEHIVPEQDTGPAFIRDTDVVD